MNRIPNIETLLQIDSGNASTAVIDVNGGYIGVYDVPSEFFNALIEQEFAELPVICTLPTVRPKHAFVIKLTKDCPERIRRSFQ